MTKFHFSTALALVSVCLTQLADDQNDSAEVEATTNAANRRTR